MGMECMSRDSSVTKYAGGWPFSNKWLQSDTVNESADDPFLSQSAPTSSSFLTNSTCRAASFPSIALAIPSHELHARSQSESGALNKIGIEIPRKFFLQETKLTPSPKKKCRVRFADECGETPLFTIRVMNEPSDYPPQIPVEVLRRHRKAAGMEDVDDTPKPKSTWKVDFKQPASEYIKFRNKLETNHVALENVIIKNEFPKIVGTIKVGNISFKKRVFLRCTSDSWKSYRDIDAKFQVSTSKAFDTFTFEVTLPCNVGIHNSSFEFCICYTTGDDQEHWDSNDGNNYKLSSEEPIQSLLSSPPASPDNKSPLIESKPLPLGKQRYMFNDAYRMDLDNNWSNFASWKQLSVDMPYW